MTGGTTLASLLFLVYFATSWVDGSNNNRYCDLRKERIYTFYYDTETGMFRSYLSTSTSDNNDIVIEGKDINDNSNRKLLLSIKLETKTVGNPAETKSSWLSSSSSFMGRLVDYDDKDSDEAIAMMNVIDEQMIKDKVRTRRLDNETANLDEKEASTLFDIIVQARKCTCGDKLLKGDNEVSSYYCPIENDYCYIPRRYNAGGLSSNFEPPNCLHENGRRHAFIKNAWPITLVSFGLLLFYGVCTLRGNFALTFVISKCFKRFNKGYANYILHEHAVRGRKMIRNWCIRRRREIEDRYALILQEQQHQNNDRGQQDSLHDSSVHEAVVEDMQLDHIEEALVRGETAQEKKQPTLLLKTRFYKENEELIIHDNVNGDIKSSKSNDDVDSTSDDNPLSQKNNSKNIYNELNQKNGDNKKPHQQYGHQHQDQGNEAISSILSEDEDEEPTEYYHVCCTICFGPIHDGDRVGALQCHHTFHVDCLKVWLKRRNVCPLCLTGDVARKT